MERAARVFGVVLLLAACTPAKREFADGLGTATVQPEATPSSPMQGATAALGGGGSAGEGPIAVDGAGGGDGVGGTMNNPSAEGGMPGVEPVAPGACSADQTRAGTTPCGSEGVLEQSCAGGSWQDTSTCLEGSVCEEQAHRAGQESCGLNARGTLDEVCVQGRWTPSLDCSDPDVCTDDTLRPGSSPCGLDNSGALEQVCTGGTWVNTDNCQNAVACTGDAPRLGTTPCGYNERGVVWEECVEGGWQDRASTAEDYCNDPDECPDGTSEVSTERCGTTGYLERFCTGGRWENDLNTCIECLHDLTFADDALDALVRQTLGLSADASIDADAVAGLETLSGIARSIYSLDGVECLTALTSLDLSQNAISDLAPLAELNHLRFLVLDYNEIVDVSPLNGLTQLEGLALGYNQITSVVAVSGMRDLRSLRLSENSIEDLTPLGPLSSLLYLYLDGNQVTGLNLIRDLSQIQLLDISYNQISDLSHLSTFSRLSILYMDATAVTTLEPIFGLPLEILDANTTPLSSIAGLEDVSSLTTLSLHNVDLSASDLAPLVDLPNLDYLQIGSTPSLDCNAPEIQALAAKVTTFYCD